MSDGFWNGSTSPGVGNSDNNSGPLITGPGGASYQYTPTGPFRDGRSDTLGDVGMDYWKRDLRPDLGNEVPVSGADPAFWQHLVTFGVGLGVTGDIDPDAAFAAIPGGADIAWGNPFSSNPAKIDDLLHFGLNSRGGYFSASNPDEFADALGDVLTAIVERVETSATSAATSAAVLQADTLLYSASFRSEDWSGNVVALEIDEIDGSVGATIWDAESVLAAGPPRNLLTHNGSSGVNLDYGLLSSDQ
jgi:type IV pilus assembly protein PilY1